MRLDLAYGFELSVDPADWAPAAHSPWTRSLCVVGDGLWLLVDRGAAGLGYLDLATLDYHDALPEGAFTVRCWDLVIGSGDEARIAFEQQAAPLT